MKSKYIIATFYISIICIILCSCSNQAEDLTNKDITNNINNIYAEDNPYVIVVKNGSPYKYPEYTYNDAFSNFFTSITWSYFPGYQTAANTNEHKPLQTTSPKMFNVVEFTGECLYRDTHVKAKIQFTINNDNTFQVSLLSYNDVPQTNMEIQSLIITVFDTYASEHKITQPPTATPDISPN